MEVNLSPSGGQEKENSCRSICPGVVASSGKVQPMSTPREEQEEQQTSSEKHEYKCNCKKDTRSKP